MIAPTLYARRLVIAALRVWKVMISPWLPPACRFVPTCSEYAAQAVAAHGVLRGGWLGLRRLSRCHPLNPGGHDPVPEMPQWQGRWP